MDLDAIERAHPAYTPIVKQLLISARTLSLGEATSPRVSSFKDPPIERIGKGEVRQWLNSLLESP